MIKNLEEITLDSYDGVKYLLSSELRIKLLRVLLESDMSLNEIKKYIDKQDTSLLRTIKELRDLDLVDYTDKKYSLTSTGYLSIRNIMNIYENWETINKYSQCINYHSFKNLPLEFARYIFVLEDSERIASNNAEYYKTRKIYGEKIKKASDLKIILPIYSKDYINFIMDAIVRNNAQLQLITSKNIYDAIKESSFGEKFKEYKKEGSIRVWYTEEDVHEIFLTISDVFSSISFFYKDNTFDDTTFFWDDEFESKDVLSALFETYKHKMSSRELI